MTAPKPPSPIRNARPSIATRWKLSEPVRLYLWPIVLVLVLSAVAGGLVTEEWAEWALPQLLTALGMLGAGEAARASVYSTTGHVDSLRGAAARWEATIRSGALDL